MDNVKDVNHSPKCESKPEENKNSAEKVKRKPRKRKLYNEICRQIEFYFSDANITKDRYMGKLVGNDVMSKVLISEFLKFNKVLSMTESLDDLVKALSNSELLLVSDCKQYVCRRYQLVEKMNVDECTIYVEKLPPTANHDWVTDVFSHYGEVVYVSLPRYKSGKLKLFGFVEFKEPEMAEKALKSFKAAGCCLDNLLSQITLPLSITSYEMENTTGNLDPKENSTYSVPENCDTRDISGPCKPDDGSQTKKLMNNAPGAEDPTKTDVEGAKKLDSTISHNIDKKSLKRANEDVKDNVVVKKLKSSEASDTNDASDVATTECISSKKKKKRKRKRKQIQAVGLELQNLGIQIMSKVHWKKLRNRYLNEQRNNMRQVKRKIYEVTHEYQKVEEDVGEKGPTLAFTPNVIAKVLLPSPVSDCQEIKKLVCEVSKPAYVDVEEGRDVVYVRFHEPSGVDGFLRTKQFENIILCSGEEEKNYWNNIFMRHKSHRRLRGRRKLLDKADKVNERKHVYFD